MRTVSVDIYLLPDTTTDMVEKIIKQLRVQLLPTLQFKPGPIRSSNVPSITIDSPMDTFMLGALVGALIIKMNSYLLNNQDIHETPGTNKD